MWPKPLLDFFIKRLSALLGFLGLMLWSVLGMAQTQIIITPTNGGGETFIVPEGVTSITVEVWGAGGRGGTRASSNGAAAGGGGGAYSRKVIAVSPGQTINYYVGFGSKTEVPGEDTWFLSNTTVMAKGGNSVDTNVTTGATGGSAGAGYGDFTRSGGNGANVTSGNGGGGGSSAGIAENGGNASNENGGIAPTGGGDGGDGRTGGQGRGEDGSPPGGGGGGSRRSNAAGTEQIGGYGGNGQIRISYIALTSVPNTDNQAVCEDDPIIDITYTVPPLSTVDILNLPPGLTSNYDSGAGIISISGTPIASGAYTINATPNYNSFIMLTRSGSVTVIPNNTVSSAYPDQTRCINTTLATITHNTTGATGIANDGIAGANGLPPGVSASWNAGVITISGTPSSSAASPYNYSILLTGGCGEIYATGSITVIPDNTVTPVGSPDQTQCINVALADIIFNTTGATGIDDDGVSGANGLPAGVSASWNAGVITISGTPTAAGLFSYSIPLTGGCGAINALGTITITPDNTATAIGSANQSQCINEALVNITFNTTGGTAIQNNGVSGANGLPPGVSASWNAGVITISGIPTSTVGSPYNYSIPLIGGCGNITATGTITVRPDNTVSPNTAVDQTLCIDTSLAEITFTTSGASGIDSDGISGANGLPPGVSATWNGNILTISGSPTEHENSPYNYSIPLIGGCNDLYAEGTITVNPASDITAENMDDQRICDGATFNEISITATGTGTLFYQWFSNDAPNKTSPTPVGTNSPSFTPPADAVGTTYYYVEVTSDCSPIATSRFMEATVEPITIITTEIDTSDDTECFGDGFDPLTVVADGADLTFQWYVNTAQQNSGGTLIPGATSNTYTPPSTEIGSFLYYYVIISGYCSSDTSVISGLYRVNPPETVIDDDPDSADYIVCRGDAFPEQSVLASGEGTITYQWYSNDVQQNTGGTLIPGATEATFPPPSDVVGTKYYYATGRSNCGTVPTAVSGAFTVTPLTEIEVENLAGQTICDVDTFNPISVSAIGTGTINYQWYSNTTASTTGSDVTMVGANSNTFSPPTTVQGTTTYYFVEVSSECGPSVTSIVSGPFTVSIDNTAAAPSSDPELCINTGLPNITIATTGATGIADDGNNTGVNGLPVGVSATWSNDVITISGTPSQSGIFNYSIPLLGGCGVVDAIGTITVTPDNTAAAPSDAPTLCINTLLTSVTIATTGATGIADDGDNTGVNGLPAGVSATWTGDVITISGTPSQSGTFNYSIPMTGGCGTVNATGIINVTPDNTAAAPSSNPTVCISSNLPNVTIVTTGATGISNDGDNSGVNGLPAGVSASWSGGIITISGTPTVEGVFNYSIPLTGGCGTINATGTITVNPLATVGPTSIAFPSVCISDPATLNFTQPTTGVISIGTPTGLPPGISASFNSTTGDITFSGTATTTGFYSYSIPLNGNCINGLEATGTIDVTPNYELTSVSSVSATVAGGSANITITGDLATLPNGTYEVTYILDDGINPPTEHTSSSFSVGNGSGTFASIPLDIEGVDVYELTIKSIKKVTDVCTIDLDINDPINTTYFSVCGAPFIANGTFFVPAGIYEITIQAAGAGAAGESGTVTIPVTPGEALGVVVGQNTGTGNGRDTWVTRDSSDPDPQSSSLIYINGGGASGPNGQVNISYSCPDSNDFDCMEVIDDGAVSGTTIIRFTCDDVWEIPEGLIEFSIYAVGAGGGGGMGPTAGGGGGGGIASTTVSSTSQFGIPAGNSLNITVGQGGSGASTVNVRGSNGGNSGVTSTIPDPGGDIDINLNALGGGGGGSFNNLNGSDGASGGGGSYSSQTDNIKGLGGSGTPGQGNDGGDGGKGNGASHARAGGGGGGAGEAGENGSGSGVGLSQPGDGGDGNTFVMNGASYGYGAGGGGIGYNFNGSPNNPGLGGSAGGIQIGGNSTPDGVGGNGTIFTGSGGGAGTTRGGQGGSGVVYITYFNFSILNVEYEQFTAEYNSQDRSGELSWTTSNEWETSHFEIERAVNNVNTWTKVGEVAAAGYSDVKIDYVFTDTQLPATGGNIFYRLRQVGLDDDFGFSVTRSIQVNPIKGNTSWIGYPNPSDLKSPVTVALIDNSGYTDGTIQVRISDIRGVFTTYSVSSPNAVSNAVNSHLENARPGMYIVQLLWGNQSEQLKLIKK